MIYDQMSVLFKASMEHSVVPRDWRRTNVDESKTMADNYRRSA